MKTFYRHELKERFGGRKIPKIEMDYFLKDNGLTYNFGKIPGKENVFDFFDSFNAHLEPLTAAAPDYSKIIIEGYEISF